MITHHDPKDAGACQKVKPCHLHIGLSATNPIFARKREFGAVIRELVDLAMIEFLRSYDAGRRKKAGARAREGGDSW